MKIQLSVVGILVGAISGCASAVDPAPAEASRIPLAEIAFAEGQKLEIYEGENGEFTYTQSGSYGVAPVSIPETLWKGGDPVKIFEALAPDQVVPEKLTAAVNRAIVAARANPPSLAEGNAQALVSTKSGASTAEETAQSQQALGSRDVTQTGSTGSPGCPAQFFELASVNGAAFCPGNSGRNWCWEYIDWGFSYVNDAAGSWGTVCVDKGVGVFKVSNGNPNGFTDSWWVNQGTWRLVRFATINSCGIFSCSPARNFKKFELANTGFGPSNSQFGGHFD